MLSPLVDDSEPIGRKILQYSYNILPFIGNLINYIAIRLLTSLIRHQSES